MIIIFPNIKGFWTTKLSQFRTKYNKFWKPDRMVIAWHGNGSIHYGRNNNSPVRG